jgi:hypothetical protein
VGFRAQLSADSGRLSSVAGLGGAPVGVQNEGFQGTARTEAAQDIGLNPGM